MNLPVELLIAICKFARPEDLKNIRLACSTLNAVAVPILFDRIYIAPGKDLLKRFESSRYKEFIREIIVDCCLLGTQPALLSSRQYALEGHCLDQCLRNGLRSLQNINQVSFCYQQPSQPVVIGQPLILAQPTQSIIPYDQRYKSMFLQSSNHEPHTQYTNAIFDMLALASISPLRITCHENDSETVFGDIATMDSRSFELRKEKTLENAQKVFRATKVVNLSLRDAGIYSYHWPVSLSDCDPLATGHLPQVLGAASDLEELSLTLYCYYGPPPPYLHPGHGEKVYYWNTGPGLEEHLLGLNTWPKLRSLKLYGCQFSGSDLTELFRRHQSSLRKAELGYSRMRYSREMPYCSWAAWLEEVRNTIGSSFLRELDLVLLRVQDRGTGLLPNSRSRYSIEDHCIYDASPENLRDYFQNDAKNPCQMGMAS